MKKLICTKNTRTFLSLEGFEVVAKILDVRPGGRTTTKRWKYAGRVEAQEGFARMLAGFRQLATQSEHIRVVE